ncbi:hypothetical protein N480_14360 [Pseudoalteromonas luteoviolacea S2607]|nr:hypothetical protein N480_14360 [Pseudoalteromonas luteoviolacea S2607]
MGVMVDNRLEAFSISEILNESTSVIVLEGKLTTAT